MSPSVKGHRSFDCKYAVIKVTNCWMSISNVSATIVKTARQNVYDKADKPKNRLPKLTANGERQYWNNDFYNCNYWKQENLQWVQQQLTLSIFIIIINKYIYEDNAIRRSPNDIVIILTFYTINVNNAVVEAKSVWLSQ